MITFINKELFSTICEKMEGKDGRPDFFRTIIQSSMNVVNKKKPGSASPKVIEHVLHTAENNLNKENTRVGIKFANDRRFVRLNQKESNKYDTPVFFIAIPYNGFVVPIQKSRNFKIYKGFTVTVDEPVEFNSCTYKHVAYIMLEPNQVILEEENNLCEFIMESFSTRKQGDEQKTFKSTCRIDFYLRDNECDYTINTMQEETGPVNVNDYAGKKTFPTFVFKKNMTSSRSNSTREDEKGKREEKPVNKAKTPVNHLTYHTTTKSLDEMIRDVDMNNDKSNRKKSKNKRRKKRR